MLTLPDSVYAFILLYMYFYAWISVHACFPKLPMFEFVGCL